MKSRKEIICSILKDKRTGEQLGDQAVQTIRRDEMIALREEEKKLKEGQYLTKQ